MLNKKIISCWEQLSLSAKRLLLLLVILFQAVLLVGYLFFQYTYINNEAARILRNTTLLEAENFEIIQDAMRYQIRVIGNAILLNHTVTPDHVDNFLDEELKRDWLDGVIVFNEKGDFVAKRANFPLEETISASSLTKASFRDRPLFKNLRLDESNDRLLTWQSNGTNPNTHGFLMYHAVRNAEGKILGGIVGYFDSRSMIEMYHKLEHKGFYLGAGGAMAVLDRENSIQLTRVGAGTTIDSLRFNSGLKSVLQFATDSAQAHRYRSPIDGTSRMGVFLNLSNHKWVMVTGFAEHEILHGWYLQVLCSVIALITLTMTQWLLLNYMHANFLQREQLAKDAMHDPLTRLPNRRYFDERARSACDMARRLRQPLCVMSIDLDYFKTVNDNYGHSGGDEVLRCVGQTLPRLVRRSDITVRLGGEEFVVVMPCTQRDTAIEVAERVRIHFANQVVDFHGCKIRFTASFGLAQITPDELDAGEGIQSGLDRADQALYHAKREGRNRVCVA